MDHALQTLRPDSSDDTIDRVISGYEALRLAAAALEGTIQCEFDPAEWLDRG